MLACTSVGGVCCAPAVSAVDSTPRMLKEPNQSQISACGTQDSKHMADPGSSPLFGCSGQSTSLHSYKGGVLVSAEPSGLCSEAQVCPQVHWNGRPASMTGAILASRKKPGVLQGAVPQCELLHVISQCPGQLSGLAVRG